MRKQLISHEPNSPKNVIKVKYKWRMQNVWNEVKFFIERVYAIFLYISGYITKEMKEMKEIMFDFVSRLGGLILTRVTCKIRSKLQVQCSIIHKPCLLRRWVKKDLMHEYQIQWNSDCIKDQVHEIKQTKSKSKLPKLVGSAAGDWIHICMHNLVFVFSI